MFNKHGRRADHHQVGPVPSAVRIDEGRDGHDVKIEGSNEKHKEQTGDLTSLFWFWFSFSSTGHVFSLFA